RNCSRNKARSSLPNSRRISPILTPGNNSIRTNTTKPPGTPASPGCFSCFQATRLGADAHFACVRVLSESISAVARGVRVVVAWLARVGLLAVAVSEGGILYNLVNL